MRIWIPLPKNSAEGEIDYDRRAFIKYTLTSIFSFCSKKSLFWVKVLNHLRGISLFLWNCVRLGLIFFAVHNLLAILFLRKFAIFGEISLSEAIFNSCEIRFAVHF